MYTVHTEFSDASKRIARVENLLTAKSVLENQVKAASAYDGEVDGKEVVFSVILDAEETVIDGYMFIAGMVMHVPLLPN